MQTRVSRSQKESSEVAERVLNAAHSREEVLLVKPECKSSLTSYPVEPALVHQSPAHLVQQPPEMLLWRKITQVAVAPLQPEAALFEIASILGEAFEVDACTIALPSPHPTQRHAAYWAAKHSPLGVRQIKLLTDDAITSVTVQNSGSLLISDLQTSEIAHLWRALPFRSLMSAETRACGQVNGVISMMRSGPHSWAEAEVELLNAVVDQVAIVISQVLLQQQVLKQTQYQSLIRRLTISIQDSVDLPKILELAIDGTAQALQVRQGFVLRLKYWDPRHSLRSNIDRVPRARVIIECAWQPENGSVVELESARTAKQGETPLIQSFWVSECVLCRQAISSSTSEALAFSDRSTFPEIPETAAIAPIFDPEKMPALLLVPLESKNKLLGFLALQHDQPRTWQPDEIELAESVSAQISSAIMQTETLRQVESLVEERTAQLQQSLELQAKLYEITRKQIEKLREMNQRMDEFLSTLSHELRTPLTSMMLAIRMLREADLPPDRRRQYLNILEQQCAQETNLINDLLALQELETKQIPIQMQKVDLKQVVTDLTQPFCQRWALKGLNLEIELPKRSPALNTDLSSLNRILLELLTNAGKYSDPNTTVSLKISQQTGQKITLMLCNDGPGISEEELPHIFEKFRRCQGVTQNAVPGTGLGLALVKSLVQHLNGTIAATSLPTEGTQSYTTCFTVTLPQNLEISE
ncbi:MAG: GAF domain-containing sensor histidine kinase [Leptolyngbyaceae cyanobacterium CSU_1_3]|nr:GAF domain-containing sensor histidine kinase [Leptolyngbyaceae cyanobacterium CSU_1_3]